MKVVLLAAGRSKRMQPIKDKNFLMFLGKPLIQHQIEALKKAGFDDIIIVGGKHNLEKLGEFGYEVVEQEDLDEGMAGAMMSVGNEIGDEPMLVVSANDVVDVTAYEEILEASKSNDFEGFLIGKKVSEYFPGGYLEVSENGRIKSIVEKPGEGNEPSDLVNIVIHLYKNPSMLFEAIKKVKTSNDDKYEVALDNLIKDGYKLQAVEFDGFWQPIKYPWHVFKVMDYFFENMNGVISDGAEIASSAVIKGNVTIEYGARVFENAVINGPAYIGKDVIVANNSLVRGSMVNEGCVVGYTTEVARSYLGFNVWTHTNYIGDSIIGDNCSFGSGTVTGNLRLDEGNIKVNVKDEAICTGSNKFGLICGENIRCGVNSSFMPGIKVGSNSMIGAGIIVPKDIPENSFVKGEFKIDIRKNKAKLDPKARGKMKKKL